MIHGYCRLLGWLIFLTCVITSSGCVRKNSAKTTLVVWGVQTSEETRIDQARVDEFERMNPDIKVSLLSMGAGGMNPQKLMTAIVGKTPPDVVYQDRFTIGDWASRDTFRPLNDFLAKDAKSHDPYAVREQDYYKACWAEANYRGKVYAIPAGTDDRCLYYSKNAFREAGLDPQKPPRTWQELREYAIRLTVYNKDGTFKRAGFIPNFGNSWLYLYSWQNDGEFMSKDGKTCTMNNPYTVESLEFMTSIYDALKGAERLDAYTRGFAALPPEMDPFITDRVAMKIDGDWFLQNIARYQPDLDFGVVPAPVPAARLRGEGRFKGEPPYITWAGGFSWAMPRGAKNVDAAWKFIQWMNSPQAMLVGCKAQDIYNHGKGRWFVPRLSANVKTNEAVARVYGSRYPKFTQPLRMFREMMPAAKFRPVTHVGQLLWDEHVKAFENATRHKLTAKQALDAGTRRVQIELDRGATIQKYPVIPLIVPLGVLVLAIAALVFGIYLVTRRAGPVGKLMRGEAVAGYLFALPWLIGFFVLTAGPFLVSIIFSFCSYDVLHPPRWVGLLNFKMLFTLDWPILRTTLVNAGYLAVFGIPLGICTGLAIAMLLNASAKGMHYYRTIYYLPSIVPIVASSLLWIWILNPDAGLLNAGWRVLLTSWSGLQPPNWLASEQWAKPALIVMGLWGAGGGMILWLAGLQGVPQHLYEAATLDGASAVQQFRHVTLPMLSPYIFFNLIMGTIGALQTFENVYIMTGGGPIDATRVPVLYLFDNAFRYFNMGYASAIAWVMFAIVMVLTLIQLKLAPRWVHYEAEKK